MLKYFLIEEYRRHISIARKYSFFVFPLYIMLFTVVGGAFISDVLKIFPYKRLIATVMISTFIYGFGVGSFEFLGKSKEENTLLTVSRILPVKIKKIYFYMFLRDSIYYTALFLIPSYIGLLISIPFSHLSTFQVSIFSLSLLISMFMGYSLSYALFPVDQRSQRNYTISLLLILIYLIFAYFFNFIFPPSVFQISKNPLWLLISAGIILIFTFAGYEFTTDEERKGGKKYRYSLPKYERIFGDTLLAKDMEDVVRGNVVIKASMTYFIPMLLLFIFVRIVNLSSGKNVYNSLSISIMLSIFSTVIYSWLTIMDDPGYFSILPLSAWSLIKTHMKTHLIIVSAISLPVILYFNIPNPLLIFPSIALFYLNAFYLLSLTVYLAGYRITSLLFDPEVVMKFSLYSIVPGMILIILTLGSNIFNYFLSSIVGILMILISIVIISKSKDKWVYFD